MSSGKVQKGQGEMLETHMHSKISYQRNPHPLVKAHKSESAAKSHAKAKKHGGPLQVFLVPSKERRLGRVERGAGEPWAEG